MFFGLNDMVFSVILLRVVMPITICAECHYIKCHNNAEYHNECCYFECHTAEYYLDECLLAECQNVEWCYAEYHLC